MQTDIQPEQKDTKNSFVYGISWVAVIVVAFFLVVPHLGFIHGRSTAGAQRTATPTGAVSASSGVISLDPTGTAVPTASANVPANSDILNRVVARTNMYRA